MDKRILIIEDEPNIVEALRYILSREGYAVDTHSDGSTAIETIKKRDPDVVILDAMLPNRSGFDILRDLRAAVQTAALPVLMLTARGQKKDRELAKRYGASQFITKPYSNSEVLACVRELSSE